MVATRTSRDIASLTPSTGTLISTSRFTSSYCRKQATKPGFLMVLVWAIRIHIESGEDAGIIIAGAFIGHEWCHVGIDDAIVMERWKQSVVGHST